MVSPHHIPLHRRTRHSALFASCILSRLSNGGNSLQTSKSTLFNLTNPTASHLHPRLRHLVSPLTIERPLRRLVLHDPSRLSLLPRCILLHAPQSLRCYRWLLPPRHHPHVSFPYACNLVLGMCQRIYTPSPPGRVHSHLRCSHHRCSQWVGHTLGPTRITDPLPDISRTYLTAPTLAKADLGPSCAPRARQSF